jgi:hypothetical protein
LIPVVAGAALIGVAYGLVTGWWTPNAVPERHLSCSYGYAAAVNSDDTARVDAWEVTSGRGSRPVNCGVLRLTGALDSLENLSR